jgi:hypothetical protein
MRPGLLCWLGIAGASAAVACSHDYQDFRFVRTHPENSGRAGDAATLPDASAGGGAGGNAAPAPDGSAGGNAAAAPDAGGRGGSDAGAVSDASSG